ncbi:uncharacterized protein DEA37_0002728 [Paragonimus westermani]|uniref:Uncharacterized protein n=1 Tax=Paragonimus westermani TaxID=34504 RepID=A0A5J4NIB8_9TREM|nr:uncharacterized protein DEA37_0002728 [Paragonimus westermani]
MHTPRTLGYCMNVVLRNTLLSLQERAAMNEQLNLRLSTLTFEKLTHMVAQTNVICDFVFSKGIFLFALPKVPPKHIFWRLTLEIYCRYTKQTEVVHTRTMSPKEFLILHSELQRVKQSLETNVKEAQRHGSQYKLPSHLQRPAHASTSSSSDTSDLNRSQCPLCRDRFEDTVNTWQLVDSPRGEQCRLEMSKYVRHLIESTGRLTTKFPADLFGDNPPAATTTRAIADGMPATSTDFSNYG